VAFKLGYPENATDFYSWLGGVVPEYRGVGIAADLMDRQHRWCQAQGFLTIRTKCFNSNRAMLLANLKWGFLITGTEATAEGLKLWLEKELVPQKS
jgi:GNAT superfamily N-acetyltransferase